MRAKEFVAEVNMSPTRLAQFAASPEAENVQAGFEAEMIFPKDNDSDNYEAEKDYDQDTNISANIDIDDIVEFFQTQHRDPNIRNIERAYDSYIEAQREEYIDNNLTAYTRTAKQNNPELSDDDAEAEARSNLEGEFEEPSLYDYLRDGEGLRYYSDFEVWYGLNWPYWTEPSDDGEFSFATAQDLADEMRRKFYMGIKVGDGYHSVPRTANQWIIEPDASLEPDEGEFGLEIISPPMPVLTMLAKLEQLLKWAPYQGGRTNESCGLHVGVSIPGMTAENVDYVKLALFLGDVYVLKQFQREFNEYTDSSLKAIHSKISTAGKDVDTMLFGLKSGLIDSLSKSIAGRNPHRTMSINVKDQYIEFRSMGGDYIDRFADIKNTVLRYAQAYVIATNPDAYRKEYVKKLAKLLNPNRDDRLTPFIKYAASLGKMTQKDLVADLMATRQDRKYDQPRTDDLAPMSDVPAGRWDRWFVTPHGGGPIQAVSARTSGEAIARATAEWPDLFSLGALSARREGTTAPRPMQSYKDFL